MCVIESGKLLPPIWVPAAQSSPEMSTAVLLVKVLPVAVNPVVGR
jgi:hypothetical protein